MGEYAETQGQLRRGDKLRTWKVTRLAGEVRGRGAWAPGVRRQGRGQGARARAVRLCCTSRGSRAWASCCGRVPTLRSLGVTAFRELPEAGKGCLIFSSLARGGSGGGGPGGELSPSGDSSGFSRLSPGAALAGGLAPSSGRALLAPLRQALGSC